MNNFRIFLVCFKNISYLCPRLSQSERAGQVKDIDGILRPTKPFVGLAKGKGVNGRYYSVPSNFANLNLCTEVVQRERLRG